MLVYIQVLMLFLIISLQKHTEWGKLEVQMITLNLKISKCPDTSCSFMYVQFFPVHLDSWIFYFSFLLQ
ncbi:hypothetical protein BDY19DRAFT_981116 [Irpex rosettiformis]|uniref:Uncharacterized protein n=1 Tax=Irpex rosettiformis TaxID=378272 RepID=A0ACB8TM64_9APHY|nr:hypothetical protein BDY19DRAFT_981116 [Irpex rosettiformis]